MSSESLLRYFKLLKITRKRKKTAPSSFGKGIQCTVPADVHGLSLKNGVGTSIICAEKCAVYVVALQLPKFCVASTFGVKYDLVSCLK